MQVYDHKYEKSVQLAKQLINRPGYGVKESLEVHGFWDESRDPDMLEFVVYATGTYTGQVNGIASVYARTEEEANEKANELNADEFEWERVYTFDDIELDQIDEVTQENP